MFDATNDIFARFWLRFVNYLPNFFGGLAFIILGFVVSAILRKIFRTLLAFIRIDAILNRTRLVELKEVRLWQDILAELLRWTVIILFLIPALESWGLSRATAVLDQFLFYIPNVIVAVIIGFVGIIAANLTADVVRNSVKSLGQASAGTLGMFAKSTILFFTILVMLNQLGVAQDLIRIFFTGLIAMLAIAGGLAFGLGGQGHAKELLDELRKKMKQG